MIAVYSQNHTKQTQILKSDTKMLLFLIPKQVVTAVI